MIDIANLLAKDLVIQSVIEGQWEYLIKDVEDLHLEISWVDCGEYLVQHVLDILEVRLVERIHTLQEKTVLNYRQIIHPLSISQQFPAEEASAIAELFVIGEWVREYRSCMRQQLPQPQPVILFLFSILVQLNLQVNSILPPVTFARSFLGISTVCLQSLQDVPMVILSSMYVMVEWLQVVRLTLICPAILDRAFSTSGVWPNAQGERKQAYVLLASSSPMPTERRAARIRKSVGGIIIKLFRYIDFQQSIIHPTITHTPPKYKTILQFPPLPPLPFALILNVDSIHSNIQMSASRVQQLRAENNQLKHRIDQLQNQRQRGNVREEIVNFVEQSKQNLLEMNRKIVEENSKQNEILHSMTSNYEQALKKQIELLTHNKALSEEKEAQDRIFNQNVEKLTQEYEVQIKHFETKVKNNVKKIQDLSGGNIINRLLRNPRFRQAMQKRGCSLDSLEKQSQLEDISTQVEQSEKEIQQAEEKSGRLDQELEKMHELIDTMKSLLENMMKEKENILKQNAVLKEKLKQSEELIGRLLGKDIKEDEQGEDDDEEEEEEEEEEKADGNAEEGA